MDNNTKDIFHALYCLMNIVTLEAGDKDVLVDVIHFCFEIQVKSFFILFFYLKSFDLVINNKTTGFKWKYKSNTSKKIISNKST
jgi:hypothetical protein